MIELKHISKRFTNICAVSDVCLKIERRERLAVLGHSGCGKTTLLRLIAGFERPDSGEIYLDGLKTNDPNILVPPFKRKIGMVFQDLALWPHMNVVENIGFGLEAVFKDRQKRREEIESILKMVYLQDRGFSYPSQLSGGERQRVALARALIRKPEILLMDEPLANVDENLKQEMIGIILNLQQAFGITLVYVTHDSTVVDSLAERVAFMKQGRIEQVKYKNEL